MTRQTYVRIHAQALTHNLRKIRELTRNRTLIAMVKANAYGCGIASVVPVLEDKVDAFGVACLEEALAIRKLGSRTPCVLFQGIFNAEEWHFIAKEGFQGVIHDAWQLEALLATPLISPVRVWLKVNTGMHRLGVAADKVAAMLSALHACPWVASPVGLMTHFACADLPDAAANQQQWDNYQALVLPDIPLLHSLSNSAAILRLPHSHADVVRPGIMLYGVSPFADETGQRLGLMPVMEFMSVISVIHHYPAGVSLGYGGIWQTQRPSVIGVVAAGYGDGYPRHVAPGTQVWIQGQRVPIVGRVSMDTFTVDLTDCTHEVVRGTPVELWGAHLPVEEVALSAGTSGYELLCQFSARV